MNELKPCPFCGRPVDEDLSDTLYPNGRYWRESTSSYYSHKNRLPDDQQCFTMHCQESGGGCGAEISADTKQEVIEKWNRRIDREMPPLPTIEPHLLEVGK